MLMTEPAIPNSFASGWSEVVNGLAGRLRLQLEDLAPGLRYAVYLELLNQSFDPVAITNQPAVLAKLIDSFGQPVDTVAYPSSGPIPVPEWAMIPRDAYVGFRIDMQTVGLPTREQGMILLAVGGITWRVGTGKYLLKTTAVFKTDVNGPPNQWLGELKLPPVELVVTDETFIE